MKRTCLRTFLLVTIVGSWCQVSYSENKMDLGRLAWLRSTLAHDGYQEYELHTLDKSGRFDYGASKYFYGSLLVDPMTRNEGRWVTFRGEHIVLSWRGEDLILHIDIAPNGAVSFIWDARADRNVDLFVTADQAGSMIVITSPGSELFTDCLASGKNPVWTDILVCGEDALSADKPRSLGPNGVGALSDAINKVHEPNCGSKLGGSVAEPGFVEEMRARAQAHRERATELREKGTYRANAEALYYERLARHEEAYADAVENMRNVENDPYSTKEDFEAAVEELREAAENLVTTEELIEETYGSGSDTTSEPIPGFGGSTGGTDRDPRCEGRVTDASRGLLFQTPGFCDDLDLMACLRKQEDAVFAATGGECWNETGPNGAPILICRGSEEEEEPTPFPPIGPGGKASGPVDGPGLPGNIGSSDTAYIDISGFGAILGVLCAGGGCPDPRP